MHYFIKNKDPGLPEDDENRNIWMDVFIVDQHTSATVNRHQWMTMFGNALLELSRCKMILNPWYSPITTTRTWCVFEQYEVSRRGIRIPRVTQSDEVATREHLNAGLSLRMIKLMFAAIHVA